MRTRHDLIRQAYTRFESGLRPARWQVIDADLAEAGLPGLTSEERDAVDWAAATGCQPFREVSHG